MKRIAVLTSLLCLAACGRGSPRAEVHRAVALSAKRLGNGLTLGAPLSANARMLVAPRWVRHVGLIGGAPAAGIFAQARLYVEPKERAAIEADSGATVSAIELVSGSSSNIDVIRLDLANAFRGVPKQGCIVPQTDGGSMRAVEYWTVPGDAGGAAVLSDWDDKPAPPNEDVLWSVLLWSGPFKATETFLGAFDPKPCDGSNDAFALPAMSATVNAVEAIDVAFRDSVHYASTAPVAAAQREVTNADAPDACVSAPGDMGFVRQDFPGFSIELPPDFVLQRAERTNRDALYYGSALYEFVAPDKSTVEISSGPDGILPHGVGGMLSSHCDRDISGHAAHVDIMNASVGAFPDLLVNVRMPKVMTFDAHAKSQVRQVQLLRAANSLQIKPQWGQASEAAKRTP